MLGLIHLLLPSQKWVGMGWDGWEEMTLWGPAYRRTHIPCSQNNDPGTAQGGVLPPPGWDGQRIRESRAALLLGECTITYQLLPEYLLFNGVLIENHLGNSVGDLQAHISQGRGAIRV